MAPGADLSQVQVELEGAKSIELAREGELLVETGLGWVALSKPVAWQERAQEKLPVQVSYELFGNNRYGFRVEGRDPSLGLVIDPILQATYLGGEGLDWASDIAVAPSGEVYVAGLTGSANFPAILALRRGALPFPTPS